MTSSYADYACSHKIVYTLGVSFLFFEAAANTKVRPVFVSGTSGTFVSGTR